MFSVYFAVTVNHDGIKDGFPRQSLSCKVFNLSTLDCSFRNLVVVPSIKSNVTSIIFLQNDIQTVSSSAFLGQSQLISIDLSLNRLNNFSGSPFQELNSLQFLNVSYNQLPFFSSKAFEGLHNLQILECAHNKVSVMSEYVFDSLPNLRVLLLHDNLLTSLPCSELSVLENLEELYLGRNPYTSVTLGPEFSNLVKLRVFHLFSLSKFTRFGNDIFQYLASEALEVVNSWIDPYHLVNIKWFEHFWKIGAIYTGPIANFDQFQPESSYLSMFDFLLHPTNHTVTKDLFNPLCSLNALSITTLVLSESFINEIEGSAFTCFSFLRELDLSRQAGSFNTLSETAFTGLDHLERLSLRANAFTHIPSTAFNTFERTGSLKHLDMGENRLDGEFPNDAFISITSLTHLDISHNPLKIIGEWVDILTNLTYFNIEGTTSTGIVASYNAFPLNCLKVLQFNNPLYSDILQDAFWANNSLTVLPQKVPNLRSLNLASVTLYTLSTIKDCAVLQKLDVSGSFTKGSIIEQWYELFFPNMELLKLAQNEIKSIEKLMLFKVTPKLTYLDLSDNVISTIDDDINALDLEYLNLNNNLLSSLDALHNLKHMKSLELANNHINSVPSVFVHTLMKSDLEVFNIVSNPLACTCAIKSFQKWIVSDNRVYIKPNVNRCNSPSQFEGLSLTQVKLDCQSHMWKYIVISSACCGFRMSNVGVFLAI